MTDPEKKDDLLSDLGSEIKSMASDGMGHPSTKPVLIGAGVGAVAGLLLPFVSLPLGAVIGAGAMLYKRVRP
jgi:acetyltransferase-like isoleucine patch superfamily enzyme